MLCSLRGGAVIRFVFGGFRLVAARPIEASPAASSSRDGGKRGVRGATRPCRRALAKVPMRAVLVVPTSEQNRIERGRDHGCMTLRLFRRLPVRADERRGSPVHPLPSCSTGKPRLSTTAATRSGPHTCLTGSIQGRDFWCTADVFWDRQAT